MARETEKNDARSRGAPGGLYAERSIYQARIYWIDRGVSPETFRRRVDGKQSLFFGKKTFIFV